MVEILRGLVLIALVLAGGAHGAEAGEAQTVDQAREALAPRFPVMLGDQRVFYVRQGIRTQTAAERAELLTEALARLADDSTIEPFKVTVDETKVSSDLMVGDRVLLSVFDGDAIDFPGMTRRQVAEAAARRIEDEVVLYRQERTPRALAIDAGIAGAVLLVAALFLLGFERLFRKGRQLVLDSANRELVKVESKMNYVSSPQSRCAGRCFCCFASSDWRFGSWWCTARSPMRSGSSRIRAALRGRSKYSSWRRSVSSP